MSKRLQNGNKKIFLEKIKKTLDKCPGLWYYTITKRKEKENKGND